jgi:hypothetical protein
MFNEERLTEDSYGALDSSWDDNDLDDGAVDGNDAWDANLDDALEPHCWECGGSGYVACTICEGDGEELCPTCTGSGYGASEDSCPDCDGYGYQDCAACGGVGEEDCTDC